MRMRYPQTWLVAILALAATKVYGTCTSSTITDPMASDATTNIEFNFPENQQNPLTPVTLIIGFNKGNPESPLRFSLLFRTGDKRMPWREKDISLKQAKEIYNKNCPGGPYIDFSPPGTNLRASQATGVTNSAYGQASTAMDFADFNGDGNFDVVAVNQGTVTVVLQDATASALSVTRYKVPVGNPSVIAADVNGDGFPDVVVSDDGSDHSPSTNGGIWVLLNNKDGTFGTPQQFSAGAQPIYVFAADFNADGKLDLAADSGAGTLAVLLGNGDGTFRAPSIVQAGSSLSALVAADLNNDGKPDIAVMDGPSNSILVMSGNGDGTFQPPVSIAGGPQYGYLIFGDFNNDGFLDLIASYSLANQAVVFLNNGTGGFTASRAYLLADYPSTLDFSPPGPQGTLLISVDDITNLPVPVFINPNGTIASVVPVDAGTTQASAIASADINGDGSGDAVITDASLGSAIVFLGTHAGTFQSPVSYPLATSADSSPTPQAVALVAMRPGGTPDLIVANSGYVNAPGGVLVALNSGSGAFGVAASFAAGTNPVALAIADFNGDGNLDVAVADGGPQFQSTTGGVSVLFGDGHGNLAAPAPYLAGSPFVTIASADVNGDGKPDLIAGTLNSNGAAAASVLLNTGSGSFKALPPVSAPNGLAKIVTGDFNGDGKVDLALIGQNIQILLGKGDGTFSTGQILATQSGANTAVVADLDGNGSLDLVVGHCCGDTEDTYLLGNGDGTFQPEVGFPSGPAPTSLALADWAGTGIPDLAISDQNGQAAGANQQQGTFLPLPNFFSPAIVSAASFQGVPIASASIATAQGRHLATSTAANQSATPPVTLAGTTVQITDITSNSQPAPLFYASPHQVNFEIPSSLASGPGVVSITASDGTVSSSGVLIQPSSPGIFMLNSAGLAAADVTQVSGGKQTNVNVYEVSNGAVVPNPINLSAADESVLLLFGTGFRAADPASVRVTFNGTAGTVLYSGAQGAFPGLDQANIVIPQHAGLHGDVVVAFSASGLSANTVHLTFQ